MMVSNRIRVLIGVFDQGLISVANLMIGVLLIRYVSKEDYGIYVIANSVILLVLGLSNGLINTQMSIRFAEKVEKKEYCQKMLASLFSITLIFSVLTFLIIYFLTHIGLIELKIAKVMYAVSVSLISILMHEFLRRYYLLSTDTLSVLVIDVIYLAIVFMYVMLLIYFSIDGLYIQVIYAYGASAFVAVLYGLYNTRLDFFQSYKNIKIVIVESWGHARWAILGVITTWLQNQSYVFLLAILMTTEEVAEANASRLFLSPISLVIVSISKIYMPRLAILKRSKSVLFLLRKITRVAIFLSCLIMLYGLSLYFVSPYIVEIFMKGYDNLNSYILIWSFVFLAQAFRVNFSIVLQVIKEFKFVTISMFLSSALLLALSVFMIKGYGVSGSIYALLFGELFIMFLFVRKLRYEK